ncbi:MAG: CDP-alcohol phosphatidyltransferase family protein [Gemmatimonadetes bacterium]|nr:CDP-alcohol phosphatidyltransferase family protein [Gemmatimonadota bacterium]MYK50186.1 CDP-alcohol phosphatidyltransferase family protein [Gemmatimonadota bacterium]
MGSTERDRFWTLSNAVSLLRVVLTLPAVWLIALGPDYVWEAFGVVVVMIVSDWVDGWLARWRDEISQWGKILDPLADKVAVGAITIAMVVFKDLPVWLVVVVLLRDAVIFLAGMYLVKRHDVLLSSNFWGKVTTLVLSGLLLAYLWDADTLKPALIGLSVVSLVVSLISYGRQFYDVLKK